MNALIHLLASPHGGITAWFVDVGIKIALLLSCCAVPALALRRPAARHALWAAGLAGSLLILVAGALPGWEIRLRSAALPLASTVSTARSRETPTWARGAGPGLSPSLPKAVVAESPFTAGVTANSASKARKGIAWDEWIGGLWLAGAAFFLIPVFLAAMTLRRLKLQSQPITSPNGIAVLREMTALIATPKQVRIAASDACRMPMAFGLLRPRMVLPPDCHGWSMERWRMVVLHELAHIRRRDPLFQFLGELCRALVWFHPLVWFARSRMAVEAEKACDDLAMQSGADPTAYAGVLLEFATYRRGKPLLPHAALHMAQQSTLEKRVRRVLNKTAARGARSAANTLLPMGMIILAAGVGILRAVASAPAADPPAKLPISLRFIDYSHDGFSEEFADPRGYVNKLHLLRESVLKTEAIQPQIGISAGEAVTNQQRITLPVTQAALDNALAEAARHPARQNEPVALLQIGEKSFLVAAVSDASFDSKHGNAPVKNNVPALGLSLPFGVSSAKAQEIAAQLNGKPVYYLTGIVKDRGMHDIPVAGFTLRAALASAAAKGEIPPAAEILIEKQLLRQVAVRSTIVFAELQRNPSKDLRLQPNDIVVVLAKPPPATAPTVIASPGEVYLLGRVDRPGSYDMKYVPTLKGAMEIAGTDGMPTGWFGMDAVLIRRVNDHEESKITVDLADLFAATVEDPPLHPNEVVNVAIHEELTESLPHATTQPRSFERQPGMP